MFLQKTILIKAAQGPAQYIQRTELDNLINLQILQRNKLIPRNFLK